MTEYERGFEDGFAAAARCATPGRAIASGFREVDATKKISIGFPDEVFEFIRARALANNCSFSAQVRGIVHAAMALTTQDRDR